ncbi:unnamed protein product [Arabidopsis halleri]
MAPTLQHFFPKVMTLSGSAQGYCSNTRCEVPEPK